MRNRILKEKDKLDREESANQLSKRHTEKPFFFSFFQLYPMVHIMDATVAKAFKNILNKKRNCLCI